MLDSHKKTFASLFEDLNGVPFNPSLEESDGDRFSLTEEADHLILMHRDAHFGGDFQIMLHYYQNENHIGIDPDLDLDRIAYLAEAQQHLGSDLAPLILSGSEAEQVASCRMAYQKLKDLYEQNDLVNAPARLIADLILSEEEDPINEIEAIIQRGDELYPLLIDLINSDQAYSPFFPGYGYAPYLAAQCLGRLKRADSLIPLFNMFQRESIFSDEVLLDAFIDLGEAAKIFLINRLKGRPLTNDNTHAAFALSVFANDLDVAHVALDQLQDPAVQKQSILCNYLLSLCHPLKNSTHKQDLIALGNKINIPKELHLQIKNLVRDWH